MDVISKAIYVEQNCETSSNKVCSKLYPVAICFHCLQTQNKNLISTALVETEIQFDFKELSKRRLRVLSKSTWRASIYAKVGNLCTTRLCPAAHTIWVKSFLLFAS